MAAKTLYEYLDECDFSDTREGQMYALVAELAWNAATKAAEEKFTSHNKQSTPCDNPLHNIQVEADGRCHWCESKVLL